MSDTEKTPQENEGAVATQEATSKKKVTKEDIDAIVKSGDRDALSQITNPKKKEEPKPAAQPAQQPAAKPETQTTPANTAPAQGAPAPEPKFWDVNYAGRVIKQPDDDGYLGFGKQSVLKRNAVIAMEERRIAQENARLHEDARKEKERLLAEREKELEDLKKKVAEQAKPVQQPVVQPVQQPAPQIEEPKRPDIPKNRLEWSEEDHEAYELYRDKQIEYRIAKERQEILSKIPASTLPPDYEELKRETQELKRQREEEKARSEKAAQEDKARKEVDDFWKKVEDFQGQIPDYKTAKPIRQQEPAIWDFAGRVAMACGLKLPAGATQDDYRRFNETALDLMERHLNSDPEVVKNTEGMQAPEGAKQYAMIYRINKKRDELIQKGELGSNASFKLVYLNHLDESGALNEGTQNLEREARLKGVQSALRAVGDVNGQFAKTLPNATGGPAPADLNKDEQRAFLKKMAGMSVFERETFLSDKDNKAQYDRIMGVPVKT